MSVQECALPSVSDQVALIPNVKEVLGFHFLELHPSDFQSEIQTTVTFHMETAGHMTH